jgi:hypothetical protein
MQFESYWAQNKVPVLHASTAESPLTASRCTAARLVPSKKALNLLRVDVLNQLIPVTESISRIDCNEWLRCYDSKGSVSTVVGVDRVQS